MCKWAANPLPSRQWMLNVLKMFVLTSVTSFLWVKIYFRGTVKGIWQKRQLVTMASLHCIRVPKYHLSKVVHSFDLCIILRMSMLYDGIFVIEINLNRTSNACDCCHYLVLYCNVFANPAFWSLLIWATFWELAGRDWLVYIFRSLNRRVFIQWHGCASSIG